MGSESFESARNQPRVKDRWSKLAAALGNRPRYGDTRPVVITRASDDDLVPTGSLEGSADDDAVARVGPRGRRVGEGAVVDGNSDAAARRSRRQRVAGDHDHARASLDPRDEATPAFAVDLVEGVPLLT